MRHRRTPQLTISSNLHACGIDHLMDHTIPTALVDRPPTWSSPTATASASPIKGVTPSPELYLQVPRGPTMAVREELWDIRGDDPSPGEGRIRGRLRGTLAVGGRA